MNCGGFLFDTFMFPLEKLGIRELRMKIIPQAEGSILEIGAGTGVNLKHLNPDKISSLVLSDLELGKNILRKAKHLHCPISLQESDVQTLPFPDETFDGVIATLVFCSVENPQEGLAEIHRVLKPKGRFYYIEHVISESPGLAAAQNFLNPGWKHMASGCNLNRDTEALLDPAGFKIITRYQKGRRILIGGIAEKKGEAA